MRVAAGVRIGIILAVATVTSPFRAFADGPAEILKYELAANQDTPELCFVLNQAVPRQPAAPFESFIISDPAAKLAAVPRRDRLCLMGFSFGVTYTITLKAGLPGVSGALAKDAQYRVQIPNRPPELAFASPTDDVLPRLGADGLPIRSVNVPRIEAEIFRVPDRDLLPERPREPLTGDMVASFAPSHGERAWRGVIETKGDANQDTVTSLAVDKTIGALKPGLYVAVAWAAGMPFASGKTLATQYFTVSDLGLTAYRAEGGLAVAVRSLATAAAVPGVDIALIARNNRELGRVRSDDTGIGRFEPGVLRGSGGDQPWGLYAYGAAGEFNVLPLSPLPPARAARAQLYPDHAQYRPGDTVRLLALLRGDQGATPPKTTLMLDIYRPDGVLFQSLSLEDQGAGGFSASFALPRSNAAGPWRVEALSGGDLAIGVTEFSVFPVNPAHLTINLGAEAALIDPEQPATVTVQAQFRGGLAAVGTPGELHVVVAPAANPFPAFPGFSFGLVDEVDPPATLDPIRFTTDGGGKATVTVKLGALPRATKPLEATITARALDIDGHGVERTTSVPIAGEALLMGLKPAMDGVFADGQAAHFEAVALGPDGERQEKAGAGWEIARQDVTPSWVWDGGRFTYRPALKDAPVASGTVDIPAASPGMIDATVPAGNYRITLFDPKGEAVSSAHFTVGSAPSLADGTSAAVVLTPGKPFYAPGDAVDIFVKPPFESDVILGAADRDIRAMVTQHVPAAGASIHLDIPRDASGGLRLVATAVAPPAPTATGLPRRAAGAGLLPADPAQRQLDVKLELPDKAQPGQMLPVPVTVTGAGEEPVFAAITLADAKEDGTAAPGGDDKSTAGGALDDRLLPDVAADDVYGRVITQSGLSMGDRDSAGNRPVAMPPAPEADLTPTVVSWSSGVVALDKTGKATVQVPLPDVSGTVRFRAIAWSASRTGEARADLAAHDPLSVVLPVPKFLGPDDRAELTLALDNIDGPRGEYHVVLRAAGAVTLQDEAEIAINLAEHEQRSQPIAILAHGPGLGSITIGIKGPNGIAFERHLSLTVQSLGPLIARHAAATVKPGAAFVLDPALVAGLRPDSIAISLTASTAGDFDLPGIARELADLDYQSAERIVDQAAPYLVPGTAENGMAQLRLAVDRVLDFQAGDGGFTLWGTGTSDPWLSAYVTEFLGRAEGAGVTVPPVALDRALDYLALHREPEPGQGGTDPSPQSLEATAYANKVLAAGKRLDIFQLRYFADRFAGQMHGPVALGLLAGAFAALDDKSGAAAFFAQASTLPGNSLAPDQYASDLRDQGMLAALMAESGAVAQPLVASALGKAGATAAARRQFSAEEAAWIFRAQSATPAPTGAVSLKIGDKGNQQTTALSFATKPGDGAGLPPIKNQADSPVRLSVTVTGIPNAPDAGAQGFEVQRTVFDATGKQVDAATVHQNDILVVVLTGHPTGQGESRPVVIDPLPAGWTMAVAAPADLAPRYPWLKDLTSVSATAVENGRYVAVPALAGDKREFKLAYVVRASVRGQFAMPGTVVEDMTQPALSARLGGGRTKVDAPAL